MRKYNLEETACQTLKKFFELVSKDASVKSELSKASSEALKKLISDKGLQAEAEKALNEALTKTAESHGFNLAMDELDEDELEAVAGGGVCKGYTFKFFEKDIPTAACYYFSD